jgi:uncharacterized protein
MAQAKFKPIKTSLLMLLIVYRYLISALLGNRCRFEPSCSHYATNAIEKYGIVKGLWLTICRLVRCHPWHPGGYNPVP